MDQKATKTLEVNNYTVRWRMLIISWRLNISIVVKHFHYCARGTVHQASRYVKVCN